MKKVLFIVLFAVLSFSFFTPLRNKEIQRDAPVSFQKNSSEENVPINEVPDGWISYTSKELKISFSYPASWNLVHSNQSLTLRGDGYDISISRGNRGLRQAAWSHPYYFVADEQAQTWEAQRAGEISGLEQIISIRDGELIFHVYTPDGTKTVSDKILGTVLSVN